MFSQHLRYCLANINNVQLLFRYRLQTCPRPKFLFHMIKTVINPAVTNSHEATLNAFISKINTIKSQISLPTCDLSEFSSCSFQLMFFSLLFDTYYLTHVNSLDIIPSWPREVLDTVGPSILSIMYCCLDCCYVPACFKHSVVHRLTENISEIDLIVTETDRSKCF